MPETTRAGDLLEREGELGALAGRLTHAMGGAGGLVVVEGAAGVGKSALLRELAATARERNATVVSAIGGELEREFPFGMVRQLLEPIVVGAPAKRREKLLSGSAALAGPVLGAAPEPGAGGGDATFATLHGLYWLVAALAEEQPLVMVMDDCHWSDASSLRFVDFLARRAAELPVLVAIGIRPGEPGAEQELLDGLMDRPETELVRPAALSRTAVEALVEEQLGDRAAEGTAAAAHETTGGNPLLLRELVRNLAGQPGPITPAAVHDVVPSTVTRSVERRLGRLPAETREVATTLAVLGDRLGPELLPAMTGLGGEEIVTAVEELRAAELLAGEPPRYAHPLLRQAVAESLPLVDRHRLHRRAAEGLRGRGDMEEQLIVHLLAAPPLREGWAELALREGARRALAEGAADAAVRRLRRAVEEHTGPTDHALMLDLGLAELRQGDPAAIGHLDTATEAADPVVAGTAVQAAMALRNLDSVADEHANAAALREALERLGPDAPEGLSHGLLGNLLNTAMLSSNLAGERQAMLAEDRNDPPEPVLALQAFEGACMEAHADEVIELARRAFASRPLLTLHKLEQPSELIAVAALSAVDGRDVADAALRDAEESARRHGSLIGRAFATYMRAEWGLVFGSALTVEADAREARVLWQETGLANMISNSASTLAQALVQMGRLDEAEDLLAPIPLGEVEWVGNIGLPARAALRLAQDRPSDAVADLQAHRELTERFGWREFARGFPNAMLATALGAAGRKDEARELAEHEVDFARRTGRHSCLVASLTALGRTLEGKEAAAALEEAVQASARSQSPVVRARAQIELGAALRREGKRVEARERLREGGELAGTAGARLLQRQALEELSIAGARQRDPFSSGIDSLTPSERRVAEHAARGMTNREIAETLFVTQKTIEVHLGNAYAKLEIRSRNQLAEALGEGAAAATGGDQRV